MAIIVNGTNIPASGNIKYGNTDITKVNVVKNGITTTVWEKVTNINALTIPYNIYHGPDSVSNDSWTQPVLHEDSIYNSDGKYRTFIDTANNQLKFLVLASGNLGYNRPNLSGNQYISFQLDVTPYKKIKVTISSICNATLSGYIRSNFSIQFDSTTISSIYTCGATNTWEEGKSNSDYTQFGTSLVIEQDISSYTGVKNIKLNNSFDASSRQNVSIRSTITSFQLLSQ